MKADITILGKRALLRYVRKFNNTTINENHNLLELPEQNTLEKYKLHTTIEYDTSSISYLTLPIYKGYA